MQQGKLALPLQQRRDDSGLYTSELTLASGDKENDANLWHRRMGHLNSQSLNILSNTAENGLEYSGTLSLCDICSMDVTTRTKLITTLTRRSHWCSPT